MSQFCAWIRVWWLPRKVPATEVLIVFWDIRSYPSALSHCRKEQIRSLCTSLGSGKEQVLLPFKTKARDASFPWPQTCRKGKGKKALISALLCRWNLSCLALALYELADNLNQLFKLVCNHWGNTVYSRGCSSIHRKLFKADGINWFRKVSLSLCW